MRVASSFACAAFVLVASLTACSGAGGSAPPSAPADGGSANDLDGGAADTSAKGPADGGSTQAPGTGSSGNGQLKILSLTATAPKLTGGSPLSTESFGTTLVAIVTDAKGLDAIAGGQLTDADGNVYTAFGAGSNKGTFTAAVDWTDMNRAAPIDFGDGGGSRELVATFFDNDGNRASAKLVLQLACRDGADTVASCSGECVTDLKRNALRCGACDKKCVGATWCSDGSCAPIPNADTAEGWLLGCFDLATVDPTASCATLCASIGKTCTTGIGFSRFKLATCDGLSSSDDPCTETFGGPHPGWATAGAKCFCDAP